MNGNTREPFRGRRATLRSRMRLDASPERIFPLLCPVREYDWIPTWSCDMIYSESGVAENDCVFATAFPEEGPRESWVVVRYEPPLAIEFVRSNADRVIRYAIRLRADGGATDLDWSQIMTGLNETGNALVDARASGEAFEATVRRLEGLLAEYLERSRAG